MHRHDSATEVLTQAILRYAVERTDDGQYFVRVRDCGAVLQVSRRHAAELLRRIRGES